MDGLDELVLLRKLALLRVLRWKMPNQISS